jgi:hypothetical protein
MEPYLKVTRHSTVSVYIYIIYILYIYIYSGVRLVKAKSAMSLFEKKHRHEIGNLLSLCNIIGTLYHDD